MGKKETPEWKSKAEDLIREGANYERVNKVLLEEHKSGIGGSTYRRFKASIFPEGMRQGALDVLKEKQEKKLNPQVKAKVWNKTKQVEADTSIFADAINEALFYFIPCPQQKLKIEQVKEINLGGAITGLVVYYTNINLNHPIIVFVTRTIVLVLKVRSMCYKLQEKYNEMKQKAKNQLPGQGSVGSMQ